jgi:hypothetical protein
MGKNPKAILDRLNWYFTLKEGSVVEPDIYLGAKIRGVVGSDGKRAWTQSSSNYIHEAVKNVETFLDERSMKLSGRADTPMSASYRPKLDISPILDPEMANWYC